MCTRPHPRDPTCNIISARPVSALHWAGSVPTKLASRSTSLVSVVTWDSSAGSAPDRPTRRSSAVTSGPVHATPYQPLAQGSPLEADHVESAPLGSPHDALAASSAFSVVGGLGGLGGDGGCSGGGDGGEGGGGGRGHAVPMLVPAYASTLPSGLAPHMSALLPRYTAEMAAMPPGGAHSGGTLALRLLSARFSLVRAASALQVVHAEDEHVWHAGDPAMGSQNTLASALAAGKPAQDGRRLLSACPSYSCGHQKSHDLPTPNNPLRL